MEKNKNVSDDTQNTASQNYPCCHFHYFLKNSRYKKIMLLFLKKIDNIPSKMCHSNY